MEKFNISMRKYLKEVGVTSQQAIERTVREKKLAGKGKLKVKMVLTWKAPTSVMWSKARSTSLTHMISRRGCFATVYAPSLREAVSFRQLYDRRRSVPRHQPARRPTQKVDAVWDSRDTEYRAERSAAWRKCRRASLGQ